MMNPFLPIAYFRDRFIPFESAQISIATHTLHYGVGAVAGLRGMPDPNNSEQVLLFRLEKHCQQLSNSAKYLRYDLPVEDIKAIIIEFIQRNKPEKSFCVELLPKLLLSNRLTTIVCLIFDPSLPGCKLKVSSGSAGGLPVIN